MLCQSPRLRPRAEVGFQGQEWAVGQDAGDRRTGLCMGWKCAECSGIYDVMIFFPARTDLQRKRRVRDSMS